MLLAADALNDLDENCGPVRERLAEDLEQHPLQQQSNFDALNQISHYIICPHTLHEDYLTV